jgi:succinate-semialdehyde dehydrogenase/glutarate-semialdehyde dehydrogenase
MEKICNGWRVAEALEYGMVGVNWDDFDHSRSVWCGVKGKVVWTWIKYGMEDYQEIKYLCFYGIE